MSAKPILIGEDNPFGNDPAMALYPLPEHASGGRLARILGLSRGQYLRTFDRVNLCDGAWDLRAARKRAAEIGGQAHREQRALVLLGRKVAAAFHLDALPPFGRVPLNAILGGLLWDFPVFLLPHPSARNRMWNEPAAEARARALLRSLLPGDAR